MPAKKTNHSSKSTNAPAKKVSTKAPAKKTAVKTSTKKAAAKAPTKKAAAKKSATPASNASADRSIYEIKITLQYLIPPIWRKVQVNSNITMGELHEVIQMAMGWDNSHMHQFVLGKRPNLKFIRMAKDLELGLDASPRYHLNEDEATIAEILPKEKSRVLYEYDFGDGWEHEILLEKILPADAEASYPHCVAGEFACPPDDVGGPPGYMNFVQALRDPRHPEHREMKEWIGRQFDPFKFEIEHVNQLFKGTQKVASYGRGR